eukprot:gene15274-32362_t
MPKGVRLKPEQIVAKLREIEIKIGQGKDVLSACREAGATDKSYYRWRREYGGMKVDQAKRLKQLEQENARLKRLVGELHLEKAVLTDRQRAAVHGAVGKYPQLSERRACLILGVARSTMRYAQVPQRDEAAL